MNVNDAMETAAAYLAAYKQEEDPIFTSEEVAITLAKEVERLQKEVAKLQMQLNVAAAAAMVELKHAKQQKLAASERRGVSMGDWHDEHEQPTERGWYLCDAVDGRWDGEFKYRAFGNGCWWIPLSDGWLSSPPGLYRWKGPPHDIMKPSPDGHDPQPAQSGEE